MISRRRQPHGESLRRYHARIVLEAIGILVVIYLLAIDALTRFAS